MQRVAMLSVHTSPLAQPGSGDGGGMNVYVRALASELARAGVAVDVLTRAEHPEQPPTIVVEPGFRVVHLDAGPRRPIPVQDLTALVPDLVDAAETRLAELGGNHRLIHANYWVSGAVGHKLKHDLDLPLVSTFHTLERVKAELGVGDDVGPRPRVEAEVVRCSDLVVASTSDERDQLQRHYGAAPERIEIVPPGVDHRIFNPGDRRRARRALGLEHVPTLLFVGRIQPLKGVDLAVETLAALDDPRAVLIVVGGPSGGLGHDELARVHDLARVLGVDSRVRFVEPQPHHRLPDYYRAADVCLVPSRSESFGLVALEAAACGTPVVAAAVGGLRSLVLHGETGFLVETRDPGAYAAHAASILAGAHPSMGATAARNAVQYRWSIAAARLRRHYDDLSARALVRCS